MLRNSHHCRPLAASLPAREVVLIVLRQRVLGLLVVPLGARPGQQPLGHRGLNVEFNGITCALSVLLDPAAPAVLDRNV